MPDNRFKIPHKFSVYMQFIYILISHIGVLSDRDIPKSQKLSTSRAIAILSKSNSYPQAGEKSYPQAEINLKSYAQVIHMLSTSWKKSYPQAEINLKSYPQAEKKVIHKQIQEPIVMHMLSTGSR